MVIIQTTLGDIHLELHTKEAPITVENFLRYVNEGYYTDTIFHRVIKGFMIQGGGLTADMQSKSTKEPIQNEAHNGLLNKRGTVAMARTYDPHSATSQFFINVVDNDFLNFRSDKGPEGFGYCVFAHVTEGMSVVDKIRAVRTGSKQGHQDVPMEDIYISNVLIS